MAYTLLLKPKARKNLDSLSGHDRAKVEFALEAIVKDPFLGKKLDGDMKDYYSIRVWPYRIVYEVYKKQLIVLVIRIGHRQGVYK